MLALLPFLLLFTATHAHGGQHQHPHDAASETSQPNPWLDQFGQVGDLSFTGTTSFAHLPDPRCLDLPGEAYDVAIIGIPFDSAVSFRPGARFGPYAIRGGSRRQLPERGYNMVLETNPYQNGARIVDCQDIPVSPYDPALAISQIEAAYTSLLHHPTPASVAGVDEPFFPQVGAVSGKTHPRLVTLGGDHTVVLPILRSLHKIHGPISVWHGDAHVDTWNPKRYPGSSTPQSQVNHGTFFWSAYEEGLLRPNGSIHAGVRTRLTGPEDLSDDITAGFKLIHGWALDDPAVGIAGVIEQIRERFGPIEEQRPVYLSIDIDVLDPSYAPGTGTPESGGWTTRELRQIIHGLKGLNIVGADVVEVSPAYDTQADLTGIAAADIVFDLLSIITLGQKERTAAAAAGLPSDDAAADAQAAFQARAGSQL